MQWLTLNNNYKIPEIGLGVWKATGPSECYKAVEAALQVGYRHFDTARIYGNEKEVGRAIRASGIPRSEVFVTTKLWNDDQGFDRAIAAARKSVEEIGLDYVDLYLIHFPMTKLRLESWQALEKIYEEGLFKAIGVSNFTVRHLQELLDVCKVVPVINQVEFHPFLNQDELYVFCREHHIQLQAYSPLAQGKKLNDPRVSAIAEKHDHTNAQIMLRWLIQKNIVVIPKSTNPRRIKENFDIFDFTLTPEDMLVLENLNENYRTSWGPTHVP